MQAVEFKTKTKKGVIEIPPDIKLAPDKEIKVIIMYEDNLTTEKDRKTGDFISELLANPLKITDFKPLHREKIYE
jgi:hypothetical protein